MLNLSYNTSYKAIEHCQMNIVGNIGDFSSTEGEKWL